MSLRVKALYYNDSGRILLCRSASGDTWGLPVADVDPDSGEEAWEAASRALARLGYEAMALRSVGGDDSVEHWLMAGRSSSYNDPGDFFEPDALPPLADEEEARVIRDTKPLSD